MIGTDWVAWHRQYDAAGPLSRRLEVVQASIAGILRAADGQVRVLSLCSGDGRDLAGAITQVGRPDTIVGRLIELDLGLAQAARQNLDAAGSAGLEVLQADAGAAASLAGATPADLVLLCGIFGNVSDEDIRRTIRAMPSICAPGARVIWTRHRRDPDLTPAMRTWFEEAGFEHEAFTPVADSTATVGVERFIGEPQPFDPGVRLFTFRETSTHWLDDLEAGAPDIVAAFRHIESGRFITVRREIRRRTGTGSAPLIVPQLATLAGAFDRLVALLPDAAFSQPGGEGDWNVAEAIGHDAHARAGLALAGAMAATGRWPASAPVVVPGVPGQAAATRDELRRAVARSQRAIERAARSIEGHETEPCPLEHPQVGRLRCGEWLLFAGVHDLMHLEQLHAIEAAFAVSSR